MREYGSCGLKTVHIYMTLKCCVGMLIPFVFDIVKHKGIYPNKISGQ